MGEAALAGDCAALAVAVVVAAAVAAVAVVGALAGAQAAAEAEDGGVCVAFGQSCASWCFLVSSTHSVNASLVVAGAANAENNKHTISNAKHTTTNNKPLLLLQCADLQS